MAQRDLWHLIIDSIGPRNQWPNNIRPLFWKRGLTNVERFKICLFVYVNGLDPELFKEWCSMAHLLNDNEAWKHVNYLFDTFENGTKYDWYWQWYVGLGCDKYVNGQTHHY